MLVILGFIILAITGCISDSSEDNSSPTSETLSSSLELVSSSSSIDLSHCEISTSNCGVFKDERDFKEYSWVKIGNQTWMAEDLKFKVLSNSYCYENSEMDCESNGRFYPWDIAMQGTAESPNDSSQVRGICPLGWHLPRVKDVEELALFLINEHDVGKPYIDDFGYQAWSEVAIYLKNKEGNLEGTPGLDSYEFNGKLNGYFNFHEVWGSSGNSDGRNLFTRYWLVERNSKELPLTFSIFSTIQDIRIDPIQMYTANNVRCIKDNEFLQQGNSGSTNTSSLNE